MSTEPIDKYLFTLIQRQFSDTHIEKQSHQHMPQNKPHRKRDNCKRSDNQTEERTIMIRIKILCIRSVKRRLIPRMPKNIFEYQKVVTLMKLDKRRSQSQQDPKPK